MAIFETAQRSRLAPALSSRRVVELAATSAAVAFLIIAAWASASSSPRDWLGDPDDALRLVSARALLDGAPWFDPTLARVGAPEPLLSHWSRLIDLPLATLIGLLRPLLGQELGELLTRLVWPTALFAALSAVMVHEAHRLGGTWVAAGAVVLVATSIGATGQFWPGRIDHHNVQILCAVAGLLLLARSVDERRLGWQAGGLLGLGLAVGYEAIGLVGPALALAGLITLLDPTRRVGVLRAAAATTGTLLAACLLTIPPAGWLKIHCDALSANILALAASGTLGLWAAHRLAMRFGTRLAILAAAVAAGVATFAALEPACLAGPFGQVDPALKSAWLDHVLESKSLLWFVRRQPAFALAQLAFLLAGAGAQVALWLRRRDAATTLRTAIVLLAVALGCWQMKLVAYASWLAVLPLARLCASLSGTTRVCKTLVRIAAIVLVSQATLEATLSLAGTVLPTTPPRLGSAELTAADPRRACFYASSLHALAALPPGLVAADLDLGPYIVALTPHRVVAAPYHRLNRGILANRAIFASRRADAEATMRALGVDYIALCNGPSDPARRAAGSLREALLDNAPVDFLTEISTSRAAAVRLWRHAPP
ncbi:MAG TPA: hypothetical protein VFR19_05915 [Hyphomicrobiaceae bacterium]|nr:hypothetical protein [Hyphomicrobiaceae bacterium]